MMPPWSSVKLPGSSWRTAVQLVRLLLAPNPARFPPAAGQAATRDGSGTRRAAICGSGVRARSMGAKAAR
jgi:hypothetical protein